VLARQIAWLPSTRWEVQHAVAARDTDPASLSAGRSPPVSREQLLIALQADHGFGSGAATLSPFVAARKRGTELSFRGIQLAQLQENDGEAHSAPWRSPGSALDGFLSWIAGSSGSLLCTISPIGEIGSARLGSAAAASRARRGDQQRAQSNPPTRPIIARSAERQMHPTVLLPATEHARRREQDERSRNRLRFIT